MLDLYKNIKKRRLDLGLSQMGLVEKVGYTDRSSIAKIEAGKIDLPQSKIVEFADALRTSPGDLMRITNENSNIDSSNASATKNLYPIKTKRFPLLGTVACGEPVFDDAYFESYVNGGDINADFCLRCKIDEEGFKEKDFDKDHSYIKATNTHFYSEMVLQFFIKKDKTGDDYF